VTEGEAVVVEVAGRANLIGDHTDYQDGLALPLALDGLTLRLEGRALGERIVLRSTLDGRTHELPLGPGDVGDAHGWGRYASAVAMALREAGQRLRPVAATIEGSLPVGAGLSSSAALELAVALAVCADPLEPLELARICQRAESEYVGVPCGLLDQLAIAFGQQEHALLLDFRDLSVEPVPWPPELALVIVHSGVERRVGGGAYAQRRAETERAAELLGVRTLRELTEADLSEALKLLPEPLDRRVRHVVSENARVLVAAEALRTADLVRLGAALDASQRSLADDYEVSTPALDALVALLADLPGALGARLTGAGFGGCAIALLRAPVDEPALDAALREYERRSGRAARRWITRPGPGIVRS
jgi:galactokinase